MTSEQPGGHTTLGVLTRVVECCQYRNFNGFYANVTDREQRCMTMGESVKMHQMRTTQRILVCVMVSVWVVVEIKDAEKEATSW